MSEWNLRPGEPVSPEKLKERAKALFKELVFWNLMLTKSPEKRKAIEHLVELRLEVQEALDILAPGWSEV